jgi:uncharacterized protein YbjT (DUF2867 family)
MKIALLGSTGFVGRELLKKCIEQGYQIKVLVKLIFACEALLKYVNIL